jgi:type IV secretory pathway VirB10-like protein
MFRKAKLDQYFLTEACPYSQKRKLNKSRVYGVGLGVGTLVIGFILFFGGKAEKKQVQATEEMTRAAEKLGENGAKPNQPIADAPGLDGFPSRYGMSRSGSSRSYSASQLVKKGSGSISVDGMPMGSTFAARLVNTVLSSDSEAPVIAEVIDDVMPKDSLLIPRGTRAIGQASFDETATRLKVRFNTLVYPDGDQHSISGLGLLQDGSSGLLGDYHSGAFKKQAGQFIGNFVSGFANGMIDRREAQQSIPYAPGSLKNGVLNGVATSASDQAKQYSTDASNIHGYLEVPSGSVFLIYLQKEYSP